MTKVNKKKRAHTHTHTQRGLLFQHTDNTLFLLLIYSVPVTVLHHDNKVTTPRPLLPRQKPVPSPTMHPLGQSTLPTSTPSPRSRKRNAGKERPIEQGSAPVTSSSSPPSSKSRGMKRSKLDIENIKVRERIWSCGYTLLLTFGNNSNKMKKIPFHRNRAVQQAQLHKTHQ